MPWVCCRPECDLSILSANEWHRILSFFLFFSVFLSQFSTQTKDMGSFLSFCLSLSVCFSFFLFFFLSFLIFSFLDANEWHWILPGEGYQFHDLQLRDPDSGLMRKRALHKASLLPLFSKREAKHNTYDVRTSPESWSRKRQASAKEKPLQTSSA